MLITETKLRIRKIFTDALRRFSCPSVRADINSSIVIYLFYSKMRFILISSLRIVNQSYGSALKWVLFFQNNPKSLDPSYKPDLDIWDCLERNPALSSLV